MAIGQTNQQSVTKDSYDMICPTYLSFLIIVIVLF